MDNTEDFEKLKEHIKKLEDINDGYIFCLKLLIDTIYRVCDGELSIEDLREFRRSMDIKMEIKDRMN